MSNLQGTAEWKATRAGRITASRMADVMAVSKRDGKPLKARADYVTELVLERITGKSIGIPMTVAMQWGVDNEPVACNAYEEHTGTILEETAFIVHPKADYVGATPDRLIGKDGLLEVKCPFNSTVHLETLLEGMPEEHIAQVQGQLWVTGREWADFVSFDPRFPEPMRLYVQRVARNPTYIGGLVTACTGVNAEVEAQVALLTAKFQLSRMAA